MLSQRVLAADAFVISPALQRKLAPDFFERAESLTVPTSVGPQIVVPTDPAIEKTQLTSDLKINSSGLAVVALQKRLKELAFDPGPADARLHWET